MFLQAQFTEEHVTLFLSGVGVLVLLSLGLVVFFVTYQRRLFAQERLRRAAEQKHQQELLAAAVDVQEAERRRIAGDLHDDIGSLLTATRLYLRQLQPDGKPQQIGMIKEQSLEILDDMIQNTRRISHDLLPPTLEKFGFQAAAEDLCERFDRSETLSVEFANATRNRLAPDTEIALYRILQELLNNTVKHAQASLIQLQLEESQDAFCFRYADNGVGFDQDKMESKGLGLRNIESRLSLVNGTLSYKTAPAAGLRVDIEVPRAATTSLKEAA